MSFSAYKSCIEKRMRIRDHSVDHYSVVFRDNRKTYGQMKPPSQFVRAAIVGGASFPPTRAFEAKKQPPEAFAFGYQQGIRLPLCERTRPRSSRSGEVPRADGRRTSWMTVTADSLQSSSYTRPLSCKRLI
jgi:hypothetical protein